MIWAAMSRFSEREVDGAQSERGAKNHGVDGTYTWVRGTNEHMNGPIRWHLPKDVDFCKIDKDRFLDRIIEKQSSP